MACFPTDTTRPTVQAAESWQDDDADSPQQPALTREQARALLAAKPGVSVWRVVGLQLAFGVAVTVLAAVIAGAMAALSAAWGALIVALPAAAFAGGMRRWLLDMKPAFALFGFAFGELLKIALTIVLLLLAPRVLPSVNWPALLIALVVTLQVYWIALLLRGRKKNS